MLKVHKVDRLRAIFVSHSHHDHVMDVPFTAKQTGAKVYGSSSALNVCRGRGVGEEQLHEFAAEDIFEINDYRIKVIRSLHSKPTILNNDLGQTIDEPLPMGAKLRDYKEGGSYDFYVEHKGKKFCLTHSYYMPDCENKTYSELSYDDVWEIVWKSMYRSADTYCPNIYKDFDCTFITGHVPVQTITKDDEAKPYVLANFIDIDGGCRAGAKPGLGNGAIFMRLDDMQDFIVPMIIPKQGSIFF